ncbi:MAG: TatD family hydrolase [Patescibacteria group bacterium]
MPKYFDIHSHLNSSKYEGDLEEVIGRLKETSTHTIVIGTDLENSKKAVEIAEKHDGIYASVGIHPVDDPSISFDAVAFEELVKSPKVVAIGECGLDFFQADKTQDYERQVKLFLDQIEFAVRHDKPLMIHGRNAEEEIVSFLEPLKAKYGEKLRGNVHFFAGRFEVAERLFAIGFTISFTGVITFTTDYDEVIKRAPLNMIMSETDAPYVAPVPYRGKRNEPSYVSEVVARIAEIRGQEFELVRGALVENAINMIR